MIRIIKASGYSVNSVNNKLYSGVFVKYSGDEAAFLMKDDGIRDNLLMLGITKKVNGITVKIYDNERMLIELLRNKNFCHMIYTKRL